MYQNNLVGTLPSSIGNFTNLTQFRVLDDSVRGPIPASVAKWTSIANFQVFGNMLSGGELPALPFDKITKPNECKLIDHIRGGSNSFNCPWPAGVTANCFKNIGNGDWVSITDKDCLEPVSNCTGLSTQLPQDQCDAWGDFYVALGGDGWTRCAGTKSDPCSCQGDNGGRPVCSTDGTTVISMCVTRRHRHCRSPLLPRPCTVH
jgi:hypothetical protein